MQSREGRGARQHSSPVDKSSEAEGGRRLGRGQARQEQATDSLGFHPPRSRALEAGGVRGLAWPWCGESWGLQLGTLATPRPHPGMARAPSSPARAVWVARAVRDEGTAAGLL